ncbi:MAG: porphobilinogen synthase [Flavobacteriales bacterium]|nr:porphobilinogen synthase [Flavobacteriales bacterium]
MKLIQRNRRLRSNASIRSLVQENTISVNDFIVPLFITEGSNVREEISSMPNYFRMSLDLIEKEVLELWSLGLKSVLLFVKVADDLKDNKGTEALNPNGLMQRAIKTIKTTVPEMLVMTDVALDPYSSYGHDGIVKDGKIINDETVAVLKKMALSHAQAGADFVAPSDMMDGRILAIREILEENSFTDVGIMSYSAKYASSFYGPFRDALDSKPGFGDKKTYQMNYANSKEAITEVLQDIEEGADIVMVKPGLPYLDIVSNISKFVEVPIAVYQVSGEYAMIKSAVKNNWLEEIPCVMESIMCFKRAGASLIATYFAKDIALYLKESKV